LANSSSGVLGKALLEKWVMFHVSYRVWLSIWWDRLQFQIVLRVGNGVFLLVRQAIDLLGSVEAPFRFVKGSLWAWYSVALIGWPSLVSRWEPVFWWLVVDRWEIWFQSRILICERGSCRWRLWFCSTAVMHRRSLWKTSNAPTVCTDLLLFSPLIVISVTRLVNGTLTYTVAELYCSSFCSLIQWTLFCWKDLCFLGPSLF